MNFATTVFNYIKKTVFGTMVVVKLFVVNKLSKISADTLGWLAVIAMHTATLPTLFALMTGVSDKTPSIDVVLMLWTALGLLFFRAVILKDFLNVITISIGFMLQAIALVLIYFK